MEIEIDQRVMKAPEDGRDLCPLHEDHYPIPTYYEIHHIVPQAWQRVWRPDGASDGLLWWTKTAPLCRTGHGNLHHFLVIFMHEWAKSGYLDSEEGAQSAAEAAISRMRHPHHHEEFAYAKQAMIDWARNGGSLQFLVNNELWGEI